MRTKSFLKHLILGALLLPTGKVVGQSTTPGNVATLSTDFLGWDNTGTNNFPLMVRHDLNQPIDWSTAAIHRMRLTPNVNTNMGPANQFPNVQRDGFQTLAGSPEARGDPAIQGTTPRSTTCTWRSHPHERSSRRACTTSPCCWMGSLW